jgi:5-carboxymethyl-2-hydroxymuconic-semialdehyde dehydrogenase
MAAHVQTDAPNVRREVPEHVLHFIGGEFVESVTGGWFDTLDPRTNRPLTHVADGQSQDIERAVKAAKDAWHHVWRRMPARERAQYLHRIADEINQDREVLAQLEALDTGIPLAQTRGQVDRAAENFRFFAEMATRITGESYPLPPHFINYTLRQPVGVAGLITPWNTPLMLETWKLAPCLAAGNTAVLKPAEWSPVTAHRLATLLARAGLPAGVVNVVQGFGETAGASLVSHPDVPLISFTGETVTGQEILRNGARYLKRFSMELGGKSPVVVFEDADFDRAVDAVLHGIFTLNGERCTAGSRLLVARAIARPFVQALMDRVRRIRIGDPLDPDTEVGPLIHPDHFQRVMGYIGLSEREGFEVATGGRRSPAWPEGNFLEPTILTGVDNAMRVAQEEIFGPVLAVIVFDSEEQALALANQVRYGLASYVWTSNMQRAHRFAEGLESGMVWINSQNVRDLRTPFGGSKASGIGREGGFYSFEFYTETKTVHQALGTHRIPKIGGNQ